MNRQECFNDIEQRLSWLVTRLEYRGAMNILDLNLHSENFYALFLNLVFGWKLENLNVVDQNAPGIDLVDANRKIVAQVSATANKTKINSGLGKAGPLLDGHNFKFISIVRADNKLRSETYRTDHKLVFDPATDIHDVISLMKEINTLPAPQMEAIRDFLKSELKVPQGPAKVESNLAAIISSLNAEGWGTVADKAETIPYEIEGKITYNKLARACSLIDEYKLHYHRLAKIYAEYDRQGSNKSLSILNGIRWEFLQLSPALPPDDLFFRTIEKVRARVQESSNHQQLPLEELNLCVEILVVDAFIRCKIFKNPAAPPPADDHS